MNTFIKWFSRNRKTIGYSIGVLNLLSGFSNIVFGDPTTGIINVIIGAFIVYDTWAFK